MTISAFLIVTLAVLALVHFVYESILAPSLRLEIRFELFKLRDELRFTKINLGNKLDDKHYHFLQDSVNTLIGNLYRFDLATITKAMIEVEKDKDLKKRVQERSRFLDDCNVAEARKIRNESIKLAFRALRVNSGGWAVYFIPVLATIACYKYALAAGKALISMSEPDFRKVAPSLHDGVAPIGIAA